MSTPSTKPTDPDTTRSRPPASLRNVGLIVVIMLVIAGSDQAIKQWVLDNLEEGVAYPIIGDWFRFYLIFNPGAAFGMGENSTWLFTTFQLVFAVGVLVASPFIRDRGTALGLALIGGGALGNLIDRLAREPGFWFGHVVDYISVGDFAIFNLADASITVGVVVFFIAMLLEDRRAASQASQREASQREATQRETSQRETNEESEEND